MCTPEDAVSILSGSQLENLEPLQLIAHWKDSIDISVWAASGIQNGVTIRYYPPPTVSDRRHRLYVSASITELSAAMVGGVASQEIIVCSPRRSLCEDLLSRQGATLYERAQVFVLQAAPRPLCDVSGVLSLTVEDARRMGLGESWEWAYLVGRAGGISRPVHTAVVDEKPVAWAIAGMATEAHEEVRGVYVLPEFRRRGYGRNVVLSTCDAILKEGRTPVYITSDDNIPSVKLAESVGMELGLTTYRILLGKDAYPNLRPRDGKDTRESGWHESTAP